MVRKHDADSLLFLDTWFVATTWLILYLIEIVGFYKFLPDCFLIVFFKFSLNFVIILPS